MARMAEMLRGLVARKSSLIMCVALCFLAATAQEQIPSGYDALVHQGNAQLQDGNNDLALGTAQSAIKLNTDRWEAYALAGGALMNLKRYEEAADDFSKAIERAPPTKQDGLRELRRKCFAAESGPASPLASAAGASEPAGTTTQAEIVLWKSIENSTNQADFQSYLKQYPNGAFTVLAQRHLEELQAQTEQVVEAKAAEERAEQNSPTAILRKGEAEIASRESREAGIHDLRAVIQQWPRSPEAREARNKLNGLGVRSTGN